MHRPCTDKVGHMTASKGWKAWFVAQTVAGPFHVHGNAAPKVSKKFSSIRMRLSRSSFLNPLLSRRRDSPPPGRRRSGITQRGSSSSWLASKPIASIIGHRWAGGNCFLKDAAQLQSRTSPFVASQTPLLSLVSVPTSTILAECD
jgi:hypothetical protein